MTTEEVTLATLDQIPCKSNRFNADELPDTFIDALKFLEKRNRNIGAAGRRTEDWAANRGAFRLRAEARTYLHYINPKPGQVVMDAGAGMGRLAVLVAPRVARLVCVDFAEKALAVLQEGARVRGIRNIETTVSDVCAPLDMPETFDSVYAVELIEQIASHRERLKAMRSFRDSLKPGGKCIVSVFPWNNRAREGSENKEGFYGAGNRRLYRYWFTEDELRQLFAEAGFRQIKIRGLIVLPNAITRRLPSSFAALETWCSRMPRLVDFSWLAIGIGIR